MRRASHIAQFVALFVMVVHMMVPHVHAWEVPKVAKSDVLTIEIAQNSPSAFPFSNIDLGIGHLENFSAAGFELLPLVHIPALKLPEIVQQDQIFPFAENRGLPNTRFFLKHHGLRAPPALS